MKSDTIEIKIKVIEESIKVTELTERERIIHDHGYELGHEAGRQFWPGLIALIVTLAFLLFCFVKCPAFP